VADRVGSLEIGGRLRTYHLHVPEAAPTPRPLVIVLHGRRISAADIRSITHFDRIADRERFVVVYPDGHERSWNDGRASTPAERDRVDDIAFMRLLIDQLVAGEWIDPTRVGVTGLSNGGVMSHRLGLELSDRISAVASVAGLMPRALAGVAPAHAVSVLIIHGAADRVAPIDAVPTLQSRLLGLLIGTRSRTSRPGGVLPLDATVTRWQSINGCATAVPLAPIAAADADPTSVDRSGWVGGPGDTAVQCWVVRGGGHTWPGGPRMVGLGRTTTRFDASEVIWDFFSAHFRPAAARRFSEH
jgi:polyhydroxybutyrate depolymerase